MSFALKIVIAVLAGILVSVGAIIHPIGPALMVFAISPFDPVFVNFFGSYGNYITALPIVLLLLKTNPGRWFHLLLGTRVQIALFVFLAIGLISHIVGYVKLGTPVLIFYLQKVAGFLLVGVIATAFRHERFIDFACKTLVVSMTAFAMLSMLDFYAGIHLVPFLGDTTELGYIDGMETENVHSSRLRGAGESLPINRFAFQLLLPIGLAMAWLTPRMRRGLGIVPAVCLIILLTALFGTISRSGLLGLAVGAAVVAVSAYRLRPGAILATLALAIVLGGGSTFVLSQLGILETVESRFTGEDLDSGSQVRQSSWSHGLRLFADSPIWGVGYGVVATERVRPMVASPDPHNAYIRMLSFHGLLGFVPFVYMLYVLLVTLMQSKFAIDEKLESWRPYFLAGFVALMVVNFFNSYFFDRLFFFVVGFAAAIEGARRNAVIASRLKLATHADQSPLGFGAVPESNAW